MVPQFGRPRAPQPVDSDQVAPGSFSYREPSRTGQNLLSEQQAAAMNGVLRAQNDRTHRALRRGGRRMASGWTIAFLAVLGLTFGSASLGLSQFQLVAVAVVVIIVVGAIGMRRGDR